MVLPSRARLAQPPALLLVALITRQQRGFAGDWGWPVNIDQICPALCPLFYHIHEPGSVFH
ncbi:MAG TPA: hypothetical protein VF099_16190 [Ktedonobacterales bacterium]